MHAAFTAPMTTSNSSWLRSAINHRGRYGRKMNG
jgi:hypothetical protein